MTDILIVDDHAVVRKGIMQILSGLPNLGIIDDVGSGKEALKLTSQKSYNLVLLDLALRGESGFQVLRQIKVEKPCLPVLILSMYGEENYGVRAKMAGAAGFVTKDETPEKLMDAISKILSGGTYFSSTINEGALVNCDATGEMVPHLRLSSREFEVMCLIAKGNRVKEISDQLCISVKTVSTHRRHIIEKMGMENNADITEYALLEALIK